jgi:hypothetical protein
MLCDERNECLMVKTKDFTQRRKGMQGYISLAACNLASLRGNKSSQKASIDSMFFASCKIDKNR